MYVCNIISSFVHPQVFGRLPVCDVALEHPSISRYHAILQHRPQEEKRREAGGTGEGEGGKGERERRVDVLSCRPSESGFYVYDLASTHGTYLNKNMIRPRSYYRVRVGQMIRFGGSSRLFVLEVRTWAMLDLNQSKAIQQPEHIFFHGK